MFSLATLAMLVAGVCSILTCPMTSMMQDRMATKAMPKPCCTLPKWQAEMVDLNSPNGLVTKIVYDTDKMLEGMWTTSISTGKLVDHILVDYRNQISYEGDYFSSPTPTCKRTQIHSPLFRCTNDSHITDMTYTGSSTLGLKGKGLDYDSFSFNASGISISISLGPIPGTDDLCYPILERLKATGLDILYMFLQVTPYIEDPSVLKMPVPCAGPNDAVVG